MDILRIKEILKEKGLTSKWLAEQIDIHEGSLSSIISGRHQPRYERLQKISDVLDVNIGDLFEKTKDDKDVLELYVEHWPDKIILNKKDNITQ